MYTLTAFPALSRSGYFSVGHRSDAALSETLFIMLVKASTSPKRNAFNDTLLACTCCYGTEGTQANCRLQRECECPYGIQHSRTNEQRRNSIHPCPSRFPASRPCVPVRLSSRQSLLVGQSPWGRYLRRVFDSKNSAGIPLRNIT